MTDTNNGWQPIDTAPRDESEVIATNGYLIAVCQHVYEDRWQPCGMPMFTPTHWMPLPDPPIAEHTPYLQALLDEKDIEI